jgi:hypothetical protein
MSTASLLFMIIGLIMAVGAFSVPTDNLVVPETSVTAPNDRATDTKVAESGSTSDEPAILLNREWALPTVKGSDSSRKDASRFLMSCRDDTAAFDAVIAARGWAKNACAAHMHVCNGDYASHSVASTNFS